jgi:UDP-2-acetamido-3-amino-2,3-dideoxy-glucuronate N-acetyltransferase
VFTNDIYPRSKAPFDEPVRTLIRHGATIGANATIVAGHTVGRYAFAGAGAVVTSDIPDFALWFGNPARQIGYVCKAGKRLMFSPDADGRLIATGQAGEKYLFSDDRVTELKE